MASTKEIKDRISSVRDTLKITNAMYLISSSKLKKAKKALAETEPFFYSLQQSVTRLLRHVPEMKSIYFEDEDVHDEEKKVGLLVVTADKGLAGAYNHNVLKAMEEQLTKYKDAKIYCMGQIGKHYLEAKGYDIDTEFNYVVQDPTLSRARSISETLIDDFRHHRVDEIVMIYTRMENAMTENAEVRQLLPLVREKFIDKRVQKLKNLPVDIPMEMLSFVPSPEAVMDRIAPEYVVGFVYGALVESFCCEHNARMTAMQSATDAGEKMLGYLSTEYNRARQAAITQEITEIVAGAKAQKKDS
ncbi:MAG: ATP synthase F1 subunit gamma [Lachnospiraceae bacterium]|nr:MAG: ATP synthase F1 subunit gamma [Lachnospiraceae bacterium]